MKGSSAPRRINRVCCCEPRANLQKGLKFVHRMYLESVLFTGNSSTQIGVICDALDVKINVHKILHKSFANHLQDLPQVSSIAALTCTRTCSLTFIFLSPQEMLETQ